MELSERVPGALRCEVSREFGEHLVQTDPQFANAGKYAQSSMKIMLVLCVFPVAIYPRTGVSLHPAFGGKIVVRAVNWLSFILRKFTMFDSKNMPADSESVVATTDGNGSGEDHLRNREAPFLLRYSEDVQFPCQRSSLLIVINTFSQTNLERVRDIDRIVRWHVHGHFTTFTKI